MCRQGTRTSPDSGRDSRTSSSGIATKTQSDVYCKTRERLNNKVSKGNGPSSEGGGVSMLGSTLHKDGDTETKGFLFKTFFTNHLLHLLVT